MSILAPSPPARSLNREDILRLGQAGRPWDFLPVAARAIDQAPDDQALRFLISANLARLGLRTLAGEQLDALPPEAQSHPDIESLRRALAGLPEDQVPPEKLWATCRANVAVLAARGHNPGAPLAAWSESLGSVRMFRDLSGNHVWSQGPGGRLSACTGFSDQAGAAARFVKSAGPLSKPASIVLDGMDSPWMFRELYDATPAQALGFHSPIHVVEPDAGRLLSALASVDLRQALADPRVRFYVGPDAAAHLEEYLLSRIDYQASALLVPGGRGRESGAQAVVERVLARQEAEFQRVRARVNEMYAGRDEAWWARRYREAGVGGPALRVLIPTCRYSTFIKHSSADLCATLKRLGHEAELYFEPDDSTRLSSVGYLRAFERLEPDLIILINFPRASMKESVPANVPYVCWIQDSLPHLFDQAIGEAQGPLDFLVGNTFIELFQKYGYPTQRAMAIGVVADEAKFFRSGKSEVGSRNGTKAPTSDIAFVSHHSETPWAMHERLCREAAHSPEVMRTFERLYTDVEGAVANAGTDWAMARLQQATVSRLREVYGHEPDQRTQTLVMRQYAGPLADRMLRHQTLDWAAGIARERGWDLKIYGRGWETHPTLAAHARPELTHGEELRACYESTGAHLHVAASTITHQRVVECFLSGGLCLSRLHKDAVTNAYLTTQFTLQAREPDVVDEENGRVGYTIADHPEAMALASTLGAAGYRCKDAHLWISLKRRQSHRQFRNVLAPDLDPTLILRDLSETTFSTQAELESLLTRAVENPSWRRAVSDMVARRARLYLTHDALVRRTLDLVRDSLDAHALREAP